MQTVPKIATKAIPMPEFGSFDLPPMPVSQQRMIEGALLFVISFSLCFAIALQV